MAKTEADKNREAILKAQKSLLTAKPKPKPDHGNRKTYRRGAGLWCRPFHSDALGVNPDQVKEATEALRAQGVMADFDKEGRCIITSDKQFREVAKASGLWDGQKGYHGGKNDEGYRTLTGRDRERAKDEFRKAVHRGDFDV